MLTFFPSVHLDMRFALASLIEGSCCKKPFTHPHQDCASPRVVTMQTRPRLGRYRRPVWSAYFAKLIRFENGNQQPKNVEYI